MHFFLFARINDIFWGVFQEDQSDYKRCERFWSCIIDIPGYCLDMDITFVAACRISFSSIDISGNAHVSDDAIKEVKILPRIRSTSTTPRIVLLSYCLSQHITGKLDCQTSNMFQFDSPGKAGITTSAIYNDIYRLIC